MEDERSFRFSIHAEKLGAWKHHLPVLVNGHRINCPIEVLQSLSIIPASSFFHENAECLNLTVCNSILEKFVTLLTTGEVLLAERHLEPFIYSSFKNKIVPLLDKCEECCIKILDTRSCLRLWLIGDSYGCGQLVSQAMELIDDNFVQVVTSPSWREIDKHRLKQILLEVKRRRIVPDEVLLEAVDHWSQYEHEFRVSEMNEVLGSLDLQNRPSHFEDPNVDLQQISSRIVCVGQEKGRLRLYGIEMNREHLNMKAFKTNVPKEIDNDCVGQFCPTSKRLFISTDGKCWIWHSGEWGQLEKLPFKRKGHMVATSNRNVFVLGGYCQESLRLSPYVHKLDTSKAKMKWSSKPKKLSICMAFGHCVSVGSFIYIFGKTSKDREIHPRIHLQRFNAQSGECTLLSDPPLKQNIGIETVIASPEGMVFIFTRTDVMEYNPESDSYRKLTSLPAPRRSFGIAIKDKTLFLYGGHSIQKETEASIADNEPTVSYCFDLRHRAPYWKPCGILNKRVDILF